MTKDNLYYSTSYTREEAVEIITKFLIRKLEKLLEKAIMILAVVAIIFLYRGEKVAKEADELLGRYENYQSLPFAEPISVEERIWHYIDSLELPKDEVKQSINSEEILQDIVVEETIEGTTLKYTQADVELLAQLMYAEEGTFFKEYSENPEKVENVHKLAGSVVIHRAEINYRGYSTIEGTIFANGQYAQQTIERVREGQDIPEIVYTWAEELLSEGALGPRGMIYQAEFEQGDANYYVEGNQYFCIETKYN